MTLSFVDWKSNGRYQASSGLHACEDTPERLAPDRVEYDIHVIRELREVMSRVIDEHIGTQSAHVVFVWGGSHGRDVCALCLGHLHGKRAYPSGTAGDEQTLASRQLGEAEYGLPRGECSQWHGSGLGKGKAPRHEGHVRCAGDGVLRESS
ncbi:hypothetical protein KCV01_g2474, partial [Aureobasidium melanogenum]